MDKTQIDELISSIKRFPIYIPSLGKKVAYERLDSDSLVWIYDIVKEDDANKILFTYTRNLWNIPFGRSGDKDVYNMSIVDAIYSIIKLRLKENDEYNNGVLNTPEEPEHPFSKAEYPSLELRDDLISDVKFRIPTLQNVFDILDVCENEDTKDYAFYLTFKYVDSISVSTTDGSKFVLDKPKDLYNFFNKIPQKSITDISKKAALVAADIINYSKIDLESDVGFLLSI